MQIKYVQSDGSKLFKFKYEFNIYRDDWKKGKILKVCEDCDRYNSIDNYASNNASNILIKHLKRFFRNLLNK